MNSLRQSPVKYDNPPINEIVCGILFDPISGLQTGQIGALWQKFKPDFSSTQDQPPIATVSEEGLHNQTKLPPLRVWFVHKEDNKIIQVQFNRFLHNWRRTRPDDKYPGYETVIENFKEYLSRFQGFLAEEKLENLVARQYELTYIDHILQNEGWDTLNDLDRALPGFTSLKSENLLSADIREIDSQLVFGLPGDFGQLQLSIRSARRRLDNRQLLRIGFTALSNQAYEPMREWFDSTHEVIIELFSTLISEEIQKQFWGRNSC